MEPDREDVDEMMRELRELQDAAEKNPAPAQRRKLLKRLRAVQFWLDMQDKKRRFLAGKPTPPDWSIQPDEVPDDIIYFLHEERVPISEVLTGRTSEWLKPPAGFAAVVHDAEGDLYEGCPELPVRAFVAFDAKNTGEAVQLWLVPYRPVIEHED